ncbi:Membrane bound O-acyl transferase MBOAT [Trinorchestia longiramus]|nr:Membrane bound O-acyl transferase MBOAT [Trinorchestia longiramus]
MDFEYDYEEGDPADYYEYDYAELSPEAGFLDDDEEWEEEEEEQRGPRDGGLSDLSGEELLEYCVGPTLSSTAPHLTALLVWVLIFTLATRTVRLPAWMSHVLSCVSGCALLWQVFGRRAVYLGGQVVAGCGSLVVAAVLHRASFAQYTVPWIITLLCLAYLLVCELWLVEATVWHSIRGAQMIILMKIISYAHDTFAPEIPGIESKTQMLEISKTKTSVLGMTKSYEEKVHQETLNSENWDDVTRKRQISSKQKQHNTPGSKQQVDGGDDKLSSRLSRAVEFCGYLLHPGSIVFGPWCSLDTYRQILRPMSWSFTWVLSIAFNLLVSCVCLLGSTCFTGWLVPDSSTRWALAYRDALSFRLSHYFVCHVSEASSLLGGVSVGPVARAHHVEVPRSLLSVVTYWNIPMHNFLKKYVFSRVRQVMGVWCAVLCTYSASAVIHGVNGQLCAVLLSLALYTHAEHTLRLKLASAFNACVLARPCRQPCSHDNKNYSSCSLVINTILGCVCVWHLAYLGVMFDSTPDSTSGYSISHTLAKWGSLSFASHWAVVFTYIVTALA